MRKLIDTYDKHTELNETYYLLGVSSPKGITNYDEEMLVRYFLYTYSHLGLSTMEILPIDRLKEQLLHELKNINNYHELCNRQKWWCLSLLYSRIGTEYYNLVFFSSTINTLLDKASNLGANELAKYCNTINDCLSNMIGFDLRIRPSKDNNKSAYISRTYLNATNNSTKIINIFRELLPLESMINEEVHKEQKLLNTIGWDFDPWTVVFDIFVGQLLISLDSPIMNMGGCNKYENATESALLNLTSKAELLPPNLNIACKKVAFYLT